jgi:energy-coupling factor transporter ATP-binding protein EcfA2
MLQKITDKCNVTIKSCTVLYLHGVTGCGKSLISRHYAAITTKFSARFELPGKSKLDFKSSLARYAEDIPGLCRPSVLTDLTTSSATGDFEAIRNQQDISINAFLGWLKTEGNDQWFILVDDLQWSDSDEATTHWIQHFISQVNQGTILITSQSPALTRVYPSLKVESLQLEESLSLMEEILGTGGDAVIQASACFRASICT